MEAINSPENIAGILEGTGPSAAINLVILVFFLFFTVLGVLFGLGRGLPKSTLRLGTIVLSAIIAFIVASSISPAIAESFEGKTLEEALATVVPEESFDDGTPIAAFLSSCDAVTAGLILELVSALFIVPTAFVTVFIVLNAVSMILFWILSAVLKLGEREKSRALGALVGAVQGALIAAIVLLPLASAASTAAIVRDSIDGIETTEEVKTTLDGVYDEYLNGVIENPVLGAINSYGGDAISHRLSTIEVAGTTVDAREELGEIIKILFTTAEFAKTDFENPDENTFDALHALADMIGDDPFTSEVLSGILRAFSTALHDGKIDNDFENPYHDMLISITDIFLNSTGATIGRNLNTMVDVYYILYDSGTIDAINNPPEGYSIEDVLVAPYNGTEDSVIDTVIAKIKDNPDTKPLITALTKFSVTIVAESLEISDDANTVYDSMKSDLYVILESRHLCSTKEELSNILIEDLGDVLRSHDIILDNKILREMSDIAAEEFLGKEEITDDDINDLILSYYDAYEKYAELG